MPEYKSKAELDKESKIPVIKRGDYELYIESIEANTQDKYQAKVDKDGKIPQEDIFKVLFIVKGFRDGNGVIFDEQGIERTDHKLFFTARPNSMGFQSSGTPAVSRDFIATLLNVDIEEELKFETWEEFQGRTIFAEVQPYTTKTGKRRNKIVRFLQPLGQASPVASQPPQVEDVPMEDDQQPAPEEEGGN